jgi:polyhydroxybutyrate depolymerase
MAARIALAVFLVACGESHVAPANWPTGDAPAETTSSEPISPACSSATKGRTGVIAEQVRVAGKNRHYTLVVPSAYVPGTSYPLVYVLHGHGGNGAQARSALDLEGVAAGHAFFLYPDGIGGGWDLDTPAARNGDVALFDATLAATQKSYCIDPRRVFVAGFSNGAYMANQLACRRGDRIRAIASHSGGGPYENGGAYDGQGHLLCDGKPVAALVVHGMADGTVAPAEGQKSIDHWSNANHCSGSGPGTLPSCVAYQGCANVVSACKVPGLGHSVWPKAKQLTWSFFDAQR